jgi:hypothetical protein
MVFKNIHKINLAVRSIELGGQAMDQPRPHSYRSGSHRILSTSEVTLHFAGNQQCSYIFFAVVAQRTALAYRVWSPTHCLSEKKGAAQCGSHSIKREIRACLSSPYVTWGFQYLMWWLLHWRGMLPRLSLFCIRSHLRFPMILVAHA